MHLSKSASENLGDFSGKHAEKQNSMYPINNCTKNEVYCGSGNFLKCL